MELEDVVINASSVDLDELKELKVRLPVRLLVNLHYVKLTSSQSISQVVKGALEEFFVRSGLGANRPEVVETAAAISSGDWLERQLEATQETTQVHDLAQ